MQLKRQLAHGTHGRGSAQGDGSVHRGSKPNGEHESASDDAPDTMIPCVLCVPWAPPSAPFRLRSRQELARGGVRDPVEPLMRWRDNLQRASETVVAASIVRDKSDPVRRQQHTLSIAVEATAAQDAIMRLLALTAILVIDPLIDVASEIIEAKRIRRKASHWSRVLEPVVVIL